MRTEPASASAGTPLPPEAVALVKFTTEFLPSKLP